jgi:peptidyl-tRNA hydrolase
MGRDPLRMYLVLRRGAIAELAHAGELAGAAAVACLRVFATQPEYEAAIAAWRERPGKVCLRARTNAQWGQVLAEPHTLAGQADSEAVVALPPRRRSERGPLLERLQAMSSALEPPPEDAPERPGAVTYALNPAAIMSSGKTVAQIAHAAVMAADTGELEDWVAAGCPGQVIAPGPERFASLAAQATCVARVVDAGLTEVAPGTVTVLALACGSSLRSRSAERTGPGARGGSGRAAG